MITIDITPAKRRFGRTPRKQWQFAISGGNGEPIDPRDTYANVNDIFDMVQKLRRDRIVVRVHYGERVEVTDFPAVEA